MLHGTDNPAAGWKPLFDWGSEPADDAAEYPPYDEVLGTFRDLRGQTHAFLDEHGAEGLDRPTKRQPPEFAGFETAGRAILIIAVHASGHLGGPNVLRAAAGKGRRFVPSAALRAF